MQSPVPMMVKRLADTIASMAGREPTDIARAVLRELENPTTEMVKAGAAIPMGRSGPGYEWAPKHFATQWRVAIQSAERD